MANIRNAISLTDGMTPVLRIINANLVQTVSIMSNLDAVTTSGVHLHETVSPEAQNIVFALNDATNAMLDLEQQVDGSAADVEAALQNATKAASDLTEQLSCTGVNKGLDEAEKKTKKLSQHMHSVKRGGFNLRNLAAGVYLLKNALATVTKLTDIPDTLNVIGFRLANLDESGASAKELMDYAYKVAQQSRSDWEATSQLASRVLQSGAVGSDAKRATDVAGLLNKATFIGGSTSRESTAALFQLSQALASGVLAGDELRSIRENAPGLTQMLSKGFHILAEAGKLGDEFLNTSVGDLKQLGSEGELTSERIIAAIEAASGIINETFVDSPKQFSQALTGIGNRFKRWLTSMTEGDNALARINEKMWQLLDWFESDAGQKFFEKITRAVNTAVDAVIKIIDWVRKAIDRFKNLESSTNILKAAFITLGTMAVASAVKTVAAWALAHAEILLVGAAIGGIAYAFADAGTDMADIAGAIIGILLEVVYMFKNGIVGIVWIFGSVGIALYHFFKIVGHVVITIVKEIVEAFKTAGKMISSYFSAVFNNVKYIAASAMLKVSEVVYNAISKIAGLIDSVFGTNLMSGLDAWASAIENVRAVVSEMDQGKSGAEAAVGTWAEYNRKFFDENGRLNLKLGDEVRSMWVEANKQAEKLSDWGFDNIHELGEGWEEGKELGKKFAEWVEEFNPEEEEKKLGKHNYYKSFPDSDDPEKYGGRLAGFFNDDFFNPTGGEIDSIGSLGKIEDDISITDEDIKMLKDIAAVEYVNKYTTLRPEMQVTFGDVKETADVKKILDVLEEMVEEAYASVLVEG